MDEQPWNILIVDDDEDDFVLTRALLAQSRESRFVAGWAASYKAALAALEKEHWDAMLVDFNLGAYTGLDLIRELITKDNRVPAILLTGQGSYDVDFEAMKAGAFDYIDKKQVNGPLLERALRYAIERFQNQEALRKANEELEVRVLERTQELVRKNEELQMEIGERKRVQVELVEVQSSLMDSVESERLHLAQELHDGPMQDLYGLSYQLESLRKASSAEDRDKELSLLQAKLQEVIHSLRVTAGELRPPTLAPYGLEKAIRSHSDQLCLNMPDLKIHLHLMADKQMLAERERLALFRIYQVAVANVIRHAKASRLDVRLILEPETVTLEIQDDGCGFEVPERWIDLARRGHLGLIGAAERAEAIGGKIEVHSKRGSGTLVRAMLPQKSS
jgi:signal transduction histidine kinase